MSKVLVETLPTRKGDRVNLLTNNRECVEAHRPTLILNHPFIKRAKNNDQLAVLVEDIPADVQDEQIDRLYKALRGDNYKNVDREGIAIKIKEAVAGALKQAKDGKSSVKDLLEAAIVTAGKKAA